MGLRKYTSILCNVSGAKADQVYLIGNSFLRYLMPCGAECAVSKPLIFPQFLHNIIFLQEPFKLKAFMFRMKFIYMTVA